MAVAVPLSASAQNGVSHPPLPAAAARWRESPEHADLFAPAARRGAYRAFVSPLELSEVLQVLEGTPELLRTPGGWQPEAVAPFDAFGQSGPYDRWRLLMLYGPARPRVARGPRTNEGLVTESWTLVSPYPDAALQRLQAGTLLIVLRLP